MKSKVHYPKGGRKPGSEARKAEKQERTGDPYRFRPYMGLSDEARYRHRMNDYGKTPDTSEPNRSGQMVSPRRTIISV